MEGSESSRHEEYKGRYACARDEVLDAISQGGWANESSGNVECATGHFSRCTITEAELAEVAEAFEEQLKDSGVKPAELVGFWLMIEDEQGFYNVTSYETEAELIFDFNRLDGIYSDWQSEGGPE